MPSTDYRPHLALATRIAQEAGALFRAEFHRPGGARGDTPSSLPSPPSAHAPIDTTAELLIRDAIAAAFPDHGIRGEEAPDRDRTPADPDKHLWLIDPNDGTKAFLEGRRGSSVSIALIRDTTPVLGVVYAYAAPDDDGDLITWAEGCGPIQRNHKPAQRAWPQQETLDDSHTLLVTPDADHNPVAWSTTCAPARFRAVPSLAYRLALVATGEGDLAFGLHAAEDLDYAAGFALLLAAGGDLFDLQGQKVRFPASQVGPKLNLIGGAPRLIPNTISRPWTQTAASPQAPFDPETDLFPHATPRPAHHTPNAKLFDLAQGCLLGLLCGGALGAPYKNQTAPQIARLFPDGGPRQMLPPPEMLAGQPCAATEAALVLARTLSMSDKYDEEALSRAYVRWYQSTPPDLDPSSERALYAAANASESGQNPYRAALSAANPESLSNTALVRVAPLGIWGHAMSLNRLMQHARADAEITHPADIIQDACALFAAILAFSIRTPNKTPRDVFAFASDTAKNMHEDIRRTLTRAVQGPPVYFDGKPKNWATTALQNAIYQLLSAPNAASGIVDTVRRGGDTEHNAAICGALLGAVYGARSLPSQWLDRVLSCRPTEALADVYVARPRGVWPVDAGSLAEDLVLALQA